MPLILLETTSLTPYLGSSSTKTFLCISISFLRALTYHLTSLTYLKQHFIPARRTTLATEMPDCNLCLIHQILYPMYHNFLLCYPPKRMVREYKEYESRVGYQV